MITQKRSPSCSCNGIYNGSFTHTLVRGVGVTAALLLNEGILLINVDDFFSKYV